MNKLTKLLSIFLIAGAVGTGVAGVAGCKNNGGTGGGGGGGDGGVHHTDQHELNYVNKNTNKHTITCNVDGCDFEATEDDHEDNKNNETEALVADGKCDFCGATMPNGGGEDEYDLVTTTFNFKKAHDDNAGNIGSDGKLTKDVTVGKFTIALGAKLETTQINTQGKDITIVLSGTENSISFNGKGASSSKATEYTLKKGDDDVTPLNWGSTANNVAADFSATGLAAGTYTLSTSASSKITNLKITEKLEKSEATGISATPAVVDFLIGQEFSSQNINVTLDYANGRQDPLDEEQYTIDKTNYVKNVAGKYTVTVKYKDDPTLTFDYDVYVYSIDEIETYTIGLSGDTQVTLQQAAVTGGTLTSNYLTVKGKGTIGEGQTARSATFNLPTSALNIELPSTATAGEQTANISVNTEYTTGGKSLTSSYKVMVKNAITPTDNKVEITVGATESDFKTVTQAVQYLKACNLGSDVNKIIKIKSGTYTEKVWIDMENVTLIGLGDITDENNKISYSLVEGDKDPITGGVWGLNCATVHVTGKNFKAYNLNINNDFDYMNDQGKYTTGNQKAQGLALTLAGDCNVLYKCHLFGNQDTLYMKGRVYAYKTQIDGNIDFIFGSNKGLAYLEECKIVAINREESSSDNPQNGYITAPQHDATYEPDYGYIFYNCEITHEQDVNANSMALGRTWGAKATVSYINCKFSEAYTTESSDGTHKIHRWCNMNGAPENANFTEYGSTDLEGNPIALPLGFVGGTVLTEVQAANYTKANIFGTSNGKVGYTTAFNCDTALSNLKKFAGEESGTATEDPVKNYNLLDYPSGDEVHSRITIADTGTNIDGIIIDATAKPAKFWNRSIGGSGQDIQIGATTVLYVPMEGNYAVSITDYNGNTLDYAKYTLDYVEDEGTHYAKIEFVSDVYIKSISVDSDTTVTLYTLAFDLNDGGAGTAPAPQKVISGQKAKPVTEPKRDGYTFNGWFAETEGGTAVDLANYVVSADGVTLHAQWTEITEAIEYTKGQIIDLNDLTQDYTSDGVTSGLDLGILCNAEATDAAIQKNGSNVKFINGATLKIKVAAGLTVLPIWDETSSETGFSITERDEEGYVTITAIGASTYIINIVIVEAQPLTAGSNEIDLTPIKVNFSGKYAANNDMFIDARNGHTFTFGVDGSNREYAQVNAGTVLKYKAPEGFTAASAADVVVAVTAYNGTDITEHFTSDFDSEHGWLILTATSSSYPGCYPATITISMPSAS